MLKKNVVSSYLWLFLAMVLIASCGGAGGGSSSSADPTYTLTGTVTGVVQQGVTITLTGAGTRTTTTSAGGAYSFAGLTNGWYTVTASLATYAFAPPSQIVGINYADKAAAGFVSTVAYSISGTVTVSGIGGTSEGVTMTLTGATLSAPVTTTTDSMGNYVLYRVVSNGTYTLTPSQSITGTECGGRLTVTETTTFTPAQRSITINNADDPGVNYSGAFNRWSGACPI